ncbi:MAG: hypothetical protein JNL26_13505 [Gemmatimonadetes bacterium]|nr:hypothetical protein [Gemmatimonadota bacterium]
MRPARTPGAEDGGYGDEWLVAHALAEFRRREGLPDDGGASAPTVSYPVGPWRVTIPNFASRRRALELHDLQHLATGYGTTWAGESQIAAWELGSGCGRFVAPWVLATAAFSVGVWLYPRITWAAFVRGRRSHSLFRLPDAARFKDGTLGTMRAAMSLPRSRPAARLSDRCWYAVASLPLVSLLVAMAGALRHWLA